MAENWSDIEVELIIADYFTMLVGELVGKPINKTHHRNQLRSLLSNRSAGSVEFKHQNISAVLIKLGLPFIRGYKPKENYQQILEEKTINYLIYQRTGLKEIFTLFADQNTELTTGSKSILSEVSAPERNLLKEPILTYKKKPFKINYLEREQMNSCLGGLGEVFAFEHEKATLLSKNLIKLAEQVERISLFDDSAGFV